MPGRPVATPAGHGPTSCPHSAASNRTSTSAMSRGMAPMARCPIARYPELQRSDIHRATIDAMRAAGFAAVTDHNDGASVGIGPMPMSVQRRPTGHDVRGVPGARPTTLQPAGPSRLGGRFRPPRRRPGGRRPACRWNAGPGSDGHPRRRHVRESADPHAFGDRSGGASRRGRDRHRRRSARCRRQPRRSPRHRLRQRLARRGHVRSDPPFHRHLPKQPVRNERAAGPHVLADRP